MSLPHDPVPTVRGDVSVVFPTDETLVCLSGDVDLSSALGLDLAAGQVIQRGCPVRVDVSAVTFMDSCGVGLIARLVAVEHQAGRRVRVEGSSPLLRELFEVTGLTAVLDLVPNAAEGLAPA
jgi:anti-sigma B factor antagonist